jgi:hypothetical protein
MSHPFPKAIGFCQDFTEIMQGVHLDMNNCQANNPDSARAHPAEDRAHRWRSYMSYGSLREME